MKKICAVAFSLFLFLIVFSQFACIKNNTGISTLKGEELNNYSEGYIKWEGRCEYKDSEEDGISKTYLYYTASGFTISFYGTYIEVEFYSQILNDSSEHFPYYNIALDDEIIPTINDDRTFYLSGGLEKITLVKNLTKSYHTVKCLKMSEPGDAMTAVTSFTTDGNFISRNTEDEKMNLRFLFVCASGGSGHGSLGYSDDGRGSLKRTTSNSSSLYSFNYLTARMFNADVQYIAQSGWGVVYPKSIFDIINYSGITISNTVKGAKSTALWNENLWKPDVIIFNIGGNDTVASNFDKNTYQKKVVELVNSMHNQYEDAYMLWTHTNSNAGNYAVAALTDAGIMKANYLKVVIIPKVGADGSVGANNHNSLKTHITTADIIADSLITNWNFNKLYDNIIFEDYLCKLVNF